MLLSVGLSLGSDLTKREVFTCGSGIKKDRNKTRSRLRADLCQAALKTDAHVIVSHMSCNYAVITVYGFNENWLQLGDFKILR